MRPCYNLISPEAAKWMNSPGPIWTANGDLETRNTDGWHNKGTVMHYTSRNCPCAKGLT